MKSKYHTDSSHARLNEIAENLPNLKLIRDFLDKLINHNTDPVEAYRTVSKQIEEMEAEREKLRSDGRSY